MLQMHLGRISRGGLISLPQYAEASDPIYDSGNSGGWNEGAGGSISTQPTVAAGAGFSPKPVKPPNVVVVAPNAPIVIEPPPPSAGAQTSVTDAMWAAGWRRAGLLTFLMALGTVGGIAAYRRYRR